MPSAVAVGNYKAFADKAFADTLLSNRKKKSQL